MEGLGKAADLGHPCVEALSLSLSLHSQIVVVLISCSLVYFVVRTTGKQYALTHSLSRLRSSACEQRATERSSEY